MSAHPFGRARAAVTIVPPPAVSTVDLGLPLDLGLRTCRVCGCWEHDACLDPRTGLPCHWVEEDLCSACGGTRRKPRAPLWLQVTSCGVATLLCVVVVAAAMLWG